MKFMRCIVACLAVGLFADLARAVIRGNDPADPRLLAVCGLQRRSVPEDENWQVEDSGVLVKWTNGSSATQYGIATIRHFID
jgi:hypothetical protein